MAWIALLASLAWGQDGCTNVRLGDITALQPPAVIVLGERRGTQPDLQRAATVARRLSRTDPVTIALEAVHRDQQKVLDDYASGQLSPLDLPELLQWDAYWSFHYDAYRRLVTGSLFGARVVGVGIEPGAPPDGAQYPIPPSYMHILADAMGDNPIPVEMEPRFVQTVAWRDHTLARAAVEAWDGRGFLVVVADRFHVEGGKGIGWQAARIAQAPVHAFLLADGGTPCYSGDRVWR